jgi:hypothetical protein
MAFPSFVISQKGQQAKNAAQKKKKKSRNLARSMRKSSERVPLFPLPNSLPSPSAGLCSLGWCKKSGCFRAEDDQSYFSRKHRRDRERDPIIKSSLRIIVSFLFRASRWSTEIKREAHSRLLKRRGFGGFPSQWVRCRFDRILLVLAETPLQPALLLLRLCAGGRREVAPGRRHGGCG